MRAVRLRCPHCGDGSLFCGWFTMNAACPRCGRVHEREPGFFLGSIYVNYGVTAVAVTALYLTLFFASHVSPTFRLVVCAAVSVLLPILFFRHARAIWVAFDEYWDPWPATESAQGPNRT